MNRRRSTVAALAAILTLAVLVAGGGSAAAAGQAPSSSACVKAGLLKPKILKIRFWLQIYEYQVGPAGYARYFFPPMPKECTADFSRSLFVHVRYKTTQRGWRTLHAIARDGKPETTWIRSGVTSEGSNGTTFLNSESSKAPWGNLQRVIARAKIVIKDRSTKGVVGEKALPVPVVFAASPRRTGL